MNPRLKNNVLIFLLVALFSSAICARQTVIEVIPLQHRPASEVLPLLVPLLDNDEQALDNGNNLVIKATAERLPSILLLIRKLDVALHNLTVSVVFSHWQTADELNATAGFDTSIPLADPKQAKGSMHGFNASTHEIDNRDSQQIVRSLEGRPAYIKTGQIRPFYNIRLYDTGYGYPASSVDTKLLETTRGFIVTPRLTENQVLLEISPWSDSIDRQGDIDTHSMQMTLRTTLGKWTEIGSVEQSLQEKKQGYLSHRRTTEQQTMRILLKVDKID